MDWKQNVNQYLTPKRQRIFLIGFVLIYALFLSYQIDKPFDGDNQGINTLFGTSAAKWIHLGPVNLKFAQVGLVGSEDTVKGAVVNGAESFYLNHPSFQMVPLALSYWIFGIGEWQTRVVPIFFSLLALIVFWFLIERLFKKPWLTATSSLLYILFPTSIFYGRLMTQEPINIFFILALYLTVILFEQEQRKRYLVGMCVATLLGGLTDWPFFFAAAAAWLYVALSKNYPQRRKVLICIALSATAAVAVTLLQIWSITHINPIAFLKNLYMRKHPLTGFLFFIFLFWRFTYDARGFTDIGLIFAIIGIILYIHAYKKDKKKLLFALFLAIPGLFTYILFYPVVTTHAYSGLYFVTPVALMAAWGISYLRKTWYVGVVCIVLIGSSLFYTSHLFAYRWYAPDDFTFVKRMSITIPATEPICIDDGSTTFYLFPHQIDVLPCPNDAYFVLRSPSGLAKRDPAPHLLQKLFESSFRENVGTTSFLVASGAEIIKFIPPLKHKLENSYRDDASVHYYATLASRAQAFIDSRSLEPLDCSTNFCFYKATSIK